MSTVPNTPFAGVDLLSETTLQAAQANILANSKAMVDKLNADLIARYQSAYADYVQNMQSGENVPADRRNPPVPPMAWELTPADPDGFVFYQIGHKPVCPQGAPVNCYGDNPQPNTQPNLIMIGQPIPGGGGKWYQALKGDTFPSGMTTPPQADGHTYEKFGAPVGPGWYLQVS